MKKRQDAAFFSFFTSAVAARMAEANVRQSCWLQNTSTGQRKQQDHWQTFVLITGSETPFTGLILKYMYIDNAGNTNFL